MLNMSVRSRWLFILIGNNETGKTTVQKVLELLNGRVYEKLPSNRAHDVTHPYSLRKCRRFFVAGRSYQELKDKGEYTSVKEYFEVKLDPAGADVDLGFMSSHLDHDAVREMLLEAHKRFWNVCGIFFTNSISINRPENAEISALCWDERWFAENCRTDDPEAQNRQLRHVAEAMVQMFIERAHGW
jgi:predicted ATP-dependent endonuclease of OLD family